MSITVYHLSTGFTLLAHEPISIKHQFKTEPWIAHPMNDQHRTDILFRLHEKYTNSMTKKSCLFLLFCQLKDLVVLFSE